MSPTSMRRTTQRCTVGSPTWRAKFALPEGLALTAPLRGTTASSSFRWSGQRNCPRFCAAWTASCTAPRRSGARRSGASSWRRWLADARLKLNALGWQGVGMFEYRWDASNGEFYLMELNGRFWGSLHLALFAGVDFPALLVACHLGRDSKVVRQWSDVSSRYTFPREIEYVLSVLKDPKVPSSRKLRAVGEFFWLGFDPRVRGDLLYASDGSLYWRTVMRTARTQLASLRRSWLQPRGHSVKLAFLRFCKAIGLFKVAKWAHREKLCILCYHGFAMNGESAFRPKLFMEPSTFTSRMEFLRKAGVRTLSLREGIEELYSGGLRDNSVVITIDDGFFSTYSVAAPVLKSHGFPATVYVTTYYALKETPIYRLFVQYAFWKTKVTRLRQSEVGEPREDLDLTDATGRDQATWALIRYGEDRSTEEQQSIAERLGRALGVDYSARTYEPMFFFDEGPGDSRLTKIWDRCPVAYSSPPLAFGSRRCAGGDRDESHGARGSRRGAFESLVLSQRRVVSGAVAVVEGSWSHQRNHMRLRLQRACDPSAGLEKISRWRRRLSDRIRIRDLRF